MRNIRLHAITGILLPILTTVSICFPTACSSSTDDSRTNEELQRLKQTRSGILSMDSLAVAVCDSILTNCTDSLTYYDYQLLKAKSYLLSKHPERSLPLLQQTETFVVNRPRTPRTNGLLGIQKATKAGYLHLIRQNSDSVVDMKLSAYELIMQSDMIDMAPDVAANLADVYISLNDMPKAAKWYRRALLLVDSLDLPEEKNTSLYMGLGQIYTLMHDYESAREFYELTESRFEELVPNMQSYFLNNYGNFFYFSGDYPRALSTFKQLQQFLKEHGMEEHHDMYLCKINLADVYLNNNQLDSAEILLNQAEGHYRRHGIEAGIYYANTIRIGIAAKRNNYDKITQILNSEKELNVTEQSLKDIRNKYLIEYYASHGNYERAFKELTRNIAQHDSLEQTFEQMRTSEIMTRFNEDTLKLRHQLAIEEQKLIVNRAHTIVWLLLCITLALMLTIFFIVSKTRRTRLQTNLDLFMLRLANNRQRISPHFIFNVLNSRLKHAGKEETSHLICLAKLIRRELDMTTKNHVSLTEELNFVKEYISIEHESLGPDFDFQMNLPSKDVLDSVCIPTMFVQILTENAIKHGLKNIDGPRRLRINVVDSESATTIDIIDNGRGFDIRNAEKDDNVKTGLNVIRQISAITNNQNKTGCHIQFAITNITDDNGDIRGCKATIIIPRGIRLI